MKFFFQGLILNIYVINLHEKICFNRPIKISVIHCCAVHASTCMVEWMDVYVNEATMNPNFCGIFVLLLLVLSHTHVDLMKFAFKDLISPLSLAHSSCQQFQQNYFFTPPIFHFVLTKAQYVLCSIYVSILTACLMCCSQQSRVATT